MNFDFLKIVLDNFLLTKLSKILGRFNNKSPNSPYGGSVIHR